MGQRADILSIGHIVPAIIPLADAFAAGATSEAVSLRDYFRATLIIQTGAIEDAGISNVVTLEACTAADGTGHVAMAFRSRVQLYSTTVDAWSALTGYNFAVSNAVANAVWMAEVTADEVDAAVADAQWVRAIIAETADKTITASGLWILTEPRYPGALPQGAII